MASSINLKIIIDQAGNAAAGLQGLSAKFGGLGGIAKTAAGGLAILGSATAVAGGYLVGLGSDAEEMQSKFNVVFGEAAGQARASLDEFGNAVGRNTFQLMDMSSGLQDILVAMGFTREEAAEMSTSMTKLSVDVGSFKNVADTDVMDRFRSGLVGNHDALDALGIAITESTLKQELLKMGIEGGVQAATEQEKVQARLNIIMAATRDAQGDAARTAGSWANQTRALKAELGEAATAMGAELLPVVTPLLKDFTAFAKDIVPKAVVIFKQFTSDLRDTAGPAMLMINDALTRIAQAFGVNTEEVSAGDVILGAFKMTLDSVVIALQLTAVVLQGAATQMENLRRVWDGVADFVRAGVDGWKRGFEGVRSAIGYVVDKFNDMRNAARRAVDAIPSWLRPGSPTPFEIGLRGIGQAAGEVGKQLPQAFSGTGKTAGIRTPGGGTGQVVVNLTYSPAISLSNRYEAEQTLAPFIAEAIRTALATR